MRPTTPTLPGLLLLLATASACNGDDGTGAPPIPDQPDDTAPEITCGGVPPEILTFTAEPDGLWQGEQGTDPQPAVQISVTAIDEDKDLSEVRLELWFDDYVDGVVDTGDAPWLDRWITISTSPCFTPTATLDIHAGAKTGTDLEPNTWYDWAMRVSDAAELSSEILFTIAGTPKEDGSDPDPRA